MRASRPIVRSPPSCSAFAGFQFPAEVIVLAVRWYLRFGLSYRDVEELLAERGIEVDHVTVYRWVQRFTPLLAEAARPCRRPVGDRWWIDETYVRVGGMWRYVHRAIDQYGQVIDVYGAAKRDSASCVPPACDHDRRSGAVGDRHRPGTGVRQLERRLRPMRHLRNDRTATVIINGHALVQNLRRRPLQPHRPDPDQPAPCHRLR